VVYPGQQEERFDQETRPATVTVRIFTLILSHFTHLDDGL